MFLLLIIIIINHKSWGKYSDNSANFLNFAIDFKKNCEYRKEVVAKMEN